MLCLTVVHTPVESLVGNVLVVASGSGARKHWFEGLNRDFWLPVQIRREANLAPEMVHLVHDPREPARLGESFVE